MMSPASSNPALTEKGIHRSCALTARRRAGRLHRPMDRREVQGQEDRDPARQVGLRQRPRDSCQAEAQRAGRQGSDVRGHQPRREGLSAIVSKLKSLASNSSISAGTTPKPASCSARRPTGLQFKLMTGDSLATAEFWPSPVRRARERCSPSRRSAPFADRSQSPRAIQGAELRTLRASPSSSYGVVQAIVEGIKRAGWTIRARSPRRWKTARPIDTLSGQV